MSPRRPFLSAAILLLALPLLAQAPVPSSAPLRLAAPLGVDPAVRIGRLPNGMAYYLRRNARPEKRVALRLAVRAGSVLEEDDQLGLAHFLEHMAFNGSRNFKPGELVAYLESIGARFGADANAYTSFDETVYMLDVPTDKPGLVEKGLVALGDFAARADLADAEIEKERGVVLEEWRLGQGASSRMQRKQLPVLFHGSRYAERLPIGTPEVLRTFTPVRLRDFARRWYRPEYMAVVAVGDIDLDAMEARIRAAFADIPKAAAAPAPPAFDVPSHAETLASVATDKEARGSSVAVVFKHPRRPSSTVADYRTSLVESLFHSILGERLDEISRGTDAPFLGASSASGGLGRSTETYNLSAHVSDGGMARGLRAVLLEAERVRRHGFHATELERAKKWMLASYERAYNERDKSESGAFAREYTAHFTDEEPIPGMEAEYQMAKELIPGITLADVGAAASRLVHREGRVVLGSAPERAGIAVATEAELRAVVEETHTVAVTPWPESAAGRALMKTPPVPGTVAATRRIEALGVTVMTLGNGVEVWLKPTDFKNDQVVLSAYSLGGASRAEAADFPEAMYAPSAVLEAGVGGLSPIEIEKALAGRLVSSAPYVRHYTHGFSGSATPRDLEPLLQLVHLQFTAPNAAPERFETIRRRLESSVANRENDPMAVYADALQRVNTADHYMFRPLTPERVKALRYATGLDFYRAHFNNAADFAFFIVGAFDEKTLTPLLAQYLGSLPSQGQRIAAFRDRALRFPPARITQEVKKGVEPRSLVTLTFFADTGLDEDETHRARSVASILRSRLRDILREEMSGTYGASVSYSNAEPLPGYGSITVSFGSAPENVASLTAAVRAEIERLQAAGPSESDVKKEIEMQTRELEVARRQNGFWLGALQGAHLMKRDPLTILKRVDRIAALTPASVREATRKYLPLDRYTVVALMPEVAPPSPAPAPSAVP